MILGISQLRLPVVFLSFVNGSNIKPYSCRTAAHRMLYLHCRLSLKGRDLQSCCLPSWGKYLVTVSVSLHYCQHGKQQFFGDSFMSGEQNGKKGLKFSFLPIPQIQDELSLPQLLFTKGGKKEKEKFNHRSLSKLPNQAFLISAAIAPILSSVAGLHFPIQ